MAIEHDIAGGGWRKLQSGSNQLDLLAMQGAGLKLKTIFNIGSIQG